MANLFGDREEELREEGFFPWETKWLSEHYMDSPGAQAMRNARKDMLADSEERGLDKKEFEAEVIGIYNEHKFFFRNGERNPFQLLDHYIRQVGDPSYPQRKQRHGNRATQRASRKERRDASETKAERKSRASEKNRSGDEKYPKGAAYH